MKMIVAMVIMVMMVSQEEGEVVIMSTVHLVMIMGIQARAAYRDSKVLDDVENVDGCPASQKEQQHHEQGHAGARNTFSVFFNFPSIFIHFFQTSIIFNFPGSIVLPGVSLASSFRKSPSYNLRSDGQRCIEILCGS